MIKFIKLIALNLSVISFASWATIEIQGEISQGGLVTGKAPVNAKVFLDDKPLVTSAEGYFAFGFGRDETASKQLVVKYANGETDSRSFTPAVREYNIQRINGIPKKIMQPSAESLQRIKQDNQQIGQARAAITTSDDFALGFIAPINGKITGVYGSQRVFNGEPKRPHYGLDYAGNTGDPVYAPAAGVVTLYVPDMFYSGGTMIIDHGLGVTSTFLHLSDAYISVGQRVKQGDKIAAVGASGRATGPHLDWRVNWFDVRLDPALALKNRPLK